LETVTVIQVVDDGGQVGGGCRGKQRLDGKNLLDRVKMISLYSEERKQFRTDPWGH
jgi:hypothetical protein